MTTFSETRAPTSRKYVTEQGIAMPNWSKTFQTFLSHSSVFNLEKLPENLNFQSFFTSNRAFGGYFQWNVDPYFQKICSWRRYSDAKLIKNISNFLVALLSFCFRKQPKNLNFQSFLPLTSPLVATFSETCAPISRKYVA